MLCLGDPRDIGPEPPGLAGLFGMEALGVLSLCVDGTERPASRARDREVALKIGLDAQEPVDVVSQLQEAHGLLPVTTGKSFHPSSEAERLPWTPGPTILCLGGVA